MRENAVYARQSVEKKNSLSISGQIELCRRSAGGEALKEYKDSGYSGKNTDRPAFKRLINDIKAEKIGTLYVYRLDRFSRSVADFGQLWEILRAHGVEFVSVNESFDTKTPMGRAMLHIIMVFAQLERETTAERVKDNYYRRAAIGQWPGGPAPYGYDIGRTEAGGRSIPTLIPNAQAETVRLIFSEYAQEEVSLGSLAKQLNESNICGINRSTWDNAMLSRLLHGTVYVKADEQTRLYLMAKGIHLASEQADFDGEHGILLVGRRRGGEENKQAGQTASVLCSSGIVSAELWLRCQEKLERNRQIGNAGKGKNTWLSGLLKCADCGYSVKTVCRGERRYLLCSGRYNLAKCGSSVKLDIGELEALVETEITKMLEALSLPEPTEESLEHMEALERIDRRIDRLITAFSEGDMSREYLKRSLTGLENEKKRIQGNSRSVERTQNKSFRLQFECLSFEEKKAAAAQFIEKIKLKDDFAELVWRV